MELAGDKHFSPSRYSNRRCSGIARSRRESGGAFTRNGGVPSRAARDAGFSERPTNPSTRITDPARCSALQQAGANRTGRRLVPYHLLSWGSFVSHVNRIDTFSAPAKSVVLTCGDASCEGFDSARNRSTPPDLS